MNNFGQSQNGQREHEGGGFYSTPSIAIPAGTVYRPNNLSMLFGIPDYPVAAGERKWFNNANLGDVRKFARPDGWTSIEGQKVYWNFVENTIDANGGLLIGYEVDSLPLVGSGAVSSVVYVVLSSSQPQFHDESFLASSRWRYGETNQVVARVPSSQAVEVGDLVYYESDAVKPASAQTNQTTKALNQSTFAAKFLGVALERSPMGEATDIRVATSGVFEFDTNSNTFVLGTLMGIEELPGRTGVETQKVDVAALAGSIGRVVRREPTASTKVWVSIKSKIIDGGTI